MRKKWMFVPFLVVILATCGQGHNEPVREETSAAPDDAYVEQAEDAIRALQRGLVEALTSAMKEGGPSNAIHVCRDDAQAITAAVAEAKGIDLGRTSHRLRNPGNAPRPWAETIVQDAAGKKTGEVDSHVVDLGDRIGVLKPINTLGLCTNCQGDPEAIEAAVRQALADAYPEDEARGFAAGDLRGWMWAEVPKAPQSP
jgi:hypothetical protein